MPIIKERYQIKSFDTLKFQTQKHGYYIKEVFSIYENGIDAEGNVLWEK